MDRILKDMVTYIEYAHEACKHNEFDLVETYMEEAITCIKRVLDMRGVCYE
jgi:hypothetical protein